MQKYLKINKKFDNIILGIDPGSNITGFSVVGIITKEPVLIDMGCWHLKSGGDHFERLKQISQEISDIIDHYKPSEMAIEAPFYGKNIQSMLKLGRAQGVAIATALGKGLKISEYSPKRIKQSITGNGNASKEQVGAMLAQILKIQIMHETLDATDALGVAICHHFQGNNLSSGPKFSGWSAYLNANPQKIKST
jgi:crossover junction endodeoxyribonuclease RuvC